MLACSPGRMPTEVGRVGEWASGRVGEWATGRLLMMIKQKQDAEYAESAERTLQQRTISKTRTTDVARLQRRSAYSASSASCCCFSAPVGSSAGVVFPLLLFRSGSSKLQNAEYAESAERTLQQRTNSKTRTTDVSRLQRRSAYSASSASCFFCFDHQVVGLTRTV